MRPESVVGQLQRWSLLVAVGAAAIIGGPRGGLDGIGVSKTAAVVLVAVVACAAAGVGAVRQRAVEFPRHPAVVVGVAFAVALLVRALLSERIGLALHGPLGRANGAVLYLACAALFVIAVVRSEPRTWGLVAKGLVVVGAVVALAGIDEATLRLGPNWAPRPGVAGTLGNANFLASWGGMMLATAVVVAIDVRLHRVWRVVAAVTGVLLLVAVTMSGSLQGVFVVGAVVAILVLVWAADRLAPAAWKLLAIGTAVAGAVATVVTVLGYSGVGPLSRIGEQVGVRLRGAYWSAAVEMVRDAPLFGVDPGAYIDRYRSTRTADAAAMVDLTSSSDSAHNVPLHLAAEAGLPIALLWLAFVVLVTWALWRGLVARTGPDRLLLGAIGAAWVGYVMQSLISIDVAPMAAVGWVLGGLIVGAVSPPMWRAGRPLPTARKGQGKGKRQVAPPASTSTGQLVGVGAVVLVAVVAAWLGTTPYRADAAWASGEVERGRTPEGRWASTPAIDLAPYESRYLVQLALELNDAGEHDRIESVLDEAVRINPLSFEAHLNRARHGVRAEDVDAARRDYERARTLDPLHPDLAVEFATFLARQGDTEGAEGLVEQALAIDPDHDGAHELLARL